MISLFGKDIKKMMKMLRNVGYKLDYVEQLLNQFDSFCHENYPKDSLLTASIAENWIYSCETPSTQQMDKRVRAMKYLGCYQRSLGRDAYMPDYRIKSPKSEPPHLFDDQQLAEFFQRLDTLQRVGNSPNRELIYPIMLRVIYCCGLRSSEACQLKVGDIDFDKGELVVNHSKGHKDRIVYMSDDIKQLCLNFHHYYQDVLPNRTYFFQPSLAKPHYYNTDVCATFDSILKKTTFFSTLVKKPSPHGLRHLFAVNSMKKCLDVGENFNHWIKYLSQYMGHKTTNETMYYLHLVPNLFPIYQEKLGELTEGLGIAYVED